MCVVCMCTVCELLCDVCGLYDVCGCAGWRREVVHRGISSSTSTSKPTADIYYFTPSNVKLVSSACVAVVCNNSDNDT